MAVRSTEAEAQPIEDLYPDGPFSSDLVIDGIPVRIKVGNVPPDLLQRLGAEVPMRAGPYVLAGFAVAENGKVLRCVVIPSTEGISGGNNTINWRDRMVKAAELFRAPDDHA